MSQPDKNSYIYGRHPVLEALRTKPDKIEKVFLRNNIEGHQVEHLKELASQNRIPITFVPGTKLHELVGSVNDQGIVALVSAIRYIDFLTWLDQVKITGYPAILLLNEIEDPHNVGAILRSAAAAGIEAVLLQKHRQAPVTPAAYKASAGTAGRIPIVRMGNINQSILQLKEAGFWIAGLDQRANTDLWELEVDRPFAFVVGNEHSGIREKTMEHCDYLFRIPMKNEVESLNASVSSAFVCFEWVRKSL